MKLEIYRTTYYDVMKYEAEYRYDLIVDNHHICCITMSKQYNADTIATGKLLRFFEDHITDMFELSDRPLAKIGAIEQDKLCEITYTDDEIAQCLYEIKKRKVAKKIADIRQDFGYEV